MQQDTFTEKISLWLDNELSPTEISELKAHLAGCPTCRQVQQAMGRVHHLLHDASAVMLEASPDFSSRLQTRLAHHRPQKSWHLWLGLSVLLLGSLFFLAVGAVLSWLSLMNTGGALVELGPIYYGLASLGGLVNNVRAVVNLLGMGVKVAWLTMTQPLFWMYILLIIGLTASWVRLMQSLYRRVPLTTQLFA